MSEGTQKPRDYFLRGFFTALPFCAISSVLLMQVRLMQSPPGEDAGTTGRLFVIIGVAQALWLVPLLVYCRWAGRRSTAAGAVTCFLLALMLNLVYHAWFYKAPGH